MKLASVSLYQNIFDRHVIATSVFFNLPASLFSLCVLQVGCSGSMDERDVTGPCGVLKKPSPTHRLILNWQKLDDQMHLEPRTSGREGGEPRSRLQPAALCPDGSSEERSTHSSSHIPVPRNRYRPLFSVFYFFASL